MRKAARTWQEINSLLLEMVEKNIYKKSVFFKNTLIYTYTEKSYNSSYHKNRGKLC